MKSPEQMRPPFKSLSAKRTRYRAKSIKAEKGSDDIVVVKREVVYESIKKMFDNEEKDLKSEK
jgi:hypothetical protein